MQQLKKIKKKAKLQKVTSLKIASKKTLRCGKKIWNKPKNIEKKHHIKIIKIEKTILYFPFFFQ